MSHFLLPVKFGAMKFKCRLNWVASSLNPWQKWIFRIRILVSVAMLILHEANVEYNSPVNSYNHLNATVPTFLVP